MKMKKEDFFEYAMPLSIYLPISIWLFWFSPWVLAQSPQNPRKASSRYVKLRDKTKKMAEEVDINTAVLSVLRSSACRDVPQGCWYDQTSKMFVPLPPQVQPQPQPQRVIPKDAVPQNVPGDLPHGVSNQETR